MIERTPTGRLAQSQPEWQFIRYGSFRLISPPSDGLRLQGMDLSSFEARVVGQYIEEPEETKT